MKLHLLILTLFIAFLSQSSWAGRNGDDQNETNNKPLVVGIISTESAKSLRKEWEPFLKDMEEQTGLKIEAFFAPDYGGLIEAMRFDKVDIARVGNASAMEAVDRAGAEVFAQMIGKSGYPGYHSVLIVHEDSDINTLDDVLKHPGKYTFGNGDPNSTSGYLVPSYYVFAKNNIDTKKHFKRVTASNHSFNALAVANKQVDIATNNTTNVGDPDRNPEEGRFWAAYPEKAAQLRIIWKSPLIPSGPLVYRGNLPEALKEKIRNFFYNYGEQDEREKALLADLGKGISDIRPADNDLLIPVRTLELQRNRLLIETDETLGNEEKQQKLSEINAQIAALNERAAELEKAAVNAGKTEKKHHE